MPPTLLAPDIQATWKPVWFLTCAQFPRVYATRDVDIPFLSSGVGFDVGDSDVGSTDVLGGGAGPPWQQAYRGILNTPVITRRLGDPAWPMVDVQDVTVVLLNEDGELTGDWRGAPFTLSAYDAGSSFLLVTWTGLIVHTSEDRGQITISGKNVDLSILEAEVPKGVIDTATFPLAVDDGACPAWLFGSVKKLPLPYVCDDLVTSAFDYLLCRGDAAALSKLRRVTPGSPTPYIVMSFDELEPYPGMDGVIDDPSFEDWDDGLTVPGPAWNLVGAGATIAKNITPAQVSEGSASASVTRVGTDVRLSQTLTTTATALVPLSWWQGREITVVVDVFATVASRALIRVDDGVTTFDSPFHTGGGTYEALTVGTVGVPCVISAAATRVRVECRIHTGNTTVHFDNVRVYLRATSLAECLRPDLYAGYTALRTFLRQEDSNGSLFQLAADVHGLQPERNPVRAIRTLLSDTTHGLAKAVDAASFDAGEIAACFTYEDAITLDAPELFLPFRDTYDSSAAQTRTVKDRSGHERDGVYDKGTAAFANFSNIGPSGGDNDAYLDCRFGDGDWIAVPDSPAFSGQSVAVRLSYQIPTLPDVTLRPIVEKLVGATTLSGYGFYRQNNNLVFFVRGADATLYTVTSPLVDVVDEDRWIEIHGEAEGGVLRLYRDGALAATGTYGSTIAEGVGDVLVAKFGTGSVNVGVDFYDNVALFSHTLAPARIAAHVAAIPLGVEPAAGGDPAAPTTFYYPMAEETGDVIMGDGSGLGHDGAWVGGPTLTVPGPLSHERGILNSFGAVRFANNVAQYGVETPLTLADAAATIAGWYRPAVLKAKGGLVEMAQGTPGVRDTQWGFCHNGARVRFTLVHAAGTLTLDVPLLAQDVGRWTFLAAAWAEGTVQVYKNGQLAIVGTYTPPAPPGVSAGDFYVGVQGSAGAATRTRPCRGDLAQWRYWASALTAQEVADMWTAATWYNGGLCVDAALRDQRAARTWLEQLCLLRGIRLGFTTDGTITVSVDAAAATSIRLHARDGAGDGERTLKAIGAGQYPALDETVADVVVRGRRDLLSDAWLVERRRTVHSNMGKDRVFELECVREHPALDRIAVYLAARLLASERTVTVSMGQEARQLMEAELVMVTDALLGFDAAVMEAKEVRKSLPEHGATVQGWSEAQYDYDPGAFPSGATSG